MKHYIIEYRVDLGGWLIRDAATQELVCICRDKEIAVALCEDLERYVQM